MVFTLEKHKTLRFDTISYFLYPRFPEAPAEHIFACALSI